MTESTESMPTAVELGGRKRPKGLVFKIGYLISIVVAMSGWSAGLVWAAALIGERLIK